MHVAISLFGRRLSDCSVSPSFAVWLCEEIRRLHSHSWFASMRFITNHDSPQALERGYSLHLMRAKFLRDDEAEEEPQHQSDGLGMGFSIRCLLSSFPVLLVSAFFAGGSGVQTTCVICRLCSVFE